MKILFVAFAVALLGCSEAVKAGDVMPEKPVMAEEEVPLQKRKDKDPSIGSCQLPNKIEGGKLFTADDGIVSLGWWSACTEGALVSLPLEQVPYPPLQVFTMITGPAHLTCHRMSDDMAKEEGVLAIYACASTLNLFTNLRYYRVPKEYPKAVPPGPRFAA